MCKEWNLSIHPEPYWLLEAMVCMNYVHTLDSEEWLNQNSSWNRRQKEEFLLPYRSYRGAMRNGLQPILEQYPMLLGYVDTSRRKYERENLRSYDPPMISFLVQMQDILEAEEPPAEEELEKALNHAFERMLGSDLQKSPDTEEIVICGLADVMAALEGWDGEDADKFKMLRLYSERREIMEQLWSLQGPCREIGRSCLGLLQERFDACMERVQDREKLAALLHGLGLQFEERCNVQIVLAVMRYDMIMLQATEPMEATEAPDGAKMKEEAEASDGAKAKKAAEAPEGAKTKEAAEAPEGAKTKEAAEVSEGAKAKEAAEVSEEAESKEAIKALEEAGAKGVTEASEKEESKEAIKALEEAGTKGVTVASEKEESKEATKALEEAETKEVTEASEKTEAKEVIEAAGAAGITSDTEPINLKIHLGIETFYLFESKGEDCYNDNRLISRLKALGDPTRLKILHQLVERPCYLQEMAKALELTPATVLHHLGILMTEDLIEIQMTKEKKKVYYQVKKQGLQEVGNGIMQLTLSRQEREARQREQQIQKMQQMQEGQQKQGGWQWTIQK